MSRISDLPDAVAAGGVLEHLGGRRPAVFLDYDGTLTPIVEDPAEARLAPEEREVVARLARSTTVGIISGRDLADVRAMVDLPGLAYAGSHGFDLLLPDGTREARGEELLPALDAAEEDLRRDLGTVEGVRVERKRFAIAVHERAVADDGRERVAEVVAEAGELHDGLRVTGGKRIHELRPDVDWHKGRALAFLVETLDLDLDLNVPLYIGDDVTDEDAFAVLTDLGGFGIVVAGEEDRPTQARYRLEDTDATLELVERLSAAL